MAPIGMNPNLVDTTGFDGADVPRVSKDEFAELVRNAIRDELQRAGIGTPEGVEVSPEAERKLAEGDLAGFVEQMIEDALTAAGLNPETPYRGQPGVAEQAGIDIPPEALEALGQGGGGGIADFVRKIVEDAIEQAGTASRDRPDPNTVRAEPTENAPGEANATGNVAFDDPVVENFLDNNVDVTGKRALSLDERIDGGVGTDPIARFDGDGGNANVTGQDNPL